MTKKALGNEHNAKVVPLCRSDPLDPWTGDTTEQLTLELDIDLPEPPTDPHGPAHPDGGKLPAWVTDQLHANRKSARWKRTAEFHRCRKCDAIVISGLDDERCAFKATVDPTPLDPRQETATLIAGRKTYDARIAGTTITLDRRDQDHMSRTGRDTVVPAHQCGARWPGFITPPHHGKAHHAPIPF